MNTKKYSKDQSSNVAEITFNPADNTLDVTFHSGKKYRYFDVNEKVFELAKEAPSIGSFVSTAIVRVYRNEQVIEPAPKL